MSCYRRLDPAAPELLGLMSTRRSLSPRKLGLPAPTPHELQLMVQASIAAPDHAGLRPWRFIEIATEARAELAEIFIAGKGFAVQNSAAMSADCLQRERDKAFSAPMLIAVCARLRRDHPKVPCSEQLVAIGAALQNFLLSAHALGYSGILLSGDRARNPKLGEALVLAGHETVLGFISIGTARVTPPPTERTVPADLLTVWRGAQT